MRPLTVTLAGVAVFAVTPSLWAQTTYTDTGDPSHIEQTILEIINRARADPFADQGRLGSLPAPIGPLPPGPPTGDIKEGLANPTWVVAKPPLAMNAKLLAAARAHSQEMYTNVYFSHTGSNGSLPGDRATAAGYTWNRVAENIAAGTGFTPYQHQDDLMIDSGDSLRGHRINLLDIFAPGTLPYREIGIGWYPGASPRDFPPLGSSAGDLQNFLTQDFGRDNSSGPFLLGVVYNDANSNGLYDEKEGMKGVTITLVPAGAWKAVTSLSGGYSFPVGTSGSITVRATGGGFGTAFVDKTVALTGENVKVDFKLSEAGLADTDGDHLPDVWEMATFGNLAQTGGGDFDGDGASNLEEFNAGSDPKDSSSLPSGGGGGGSPPPPPSTKKGGGGGGCGLSGLDVLLLVGASLLLKRIARRCRPA